MLFNIEQTRLITRRRQPNNVGNAMIGLRQAWPGSFHNLMVQSNRN